MLTLSQDQRDRLVLLRQWQEGLLTAVEGAQRLGLSVRHFRRLCRRFEAEGDASVLGQPRHREGNPRYAPEVVKGVLEQAGSPLYRDFGPTLLSEHVPAAVPSWTVRRWLMKAGLWEARQQRLKHRRRRPRRRRYGELVLMDTSTHDWLEGRSPETLHLIAMIDDATSDLHARFCLRDSGVMNQLVLMEWLGSRGRMEALYTDQASHFSRSADGKRTQSVIRRGLESLGSELILAFSPEAKGRVERLFGTLQDRLVKEMRIARISSLEEANAFLDAHFIPFWRKRFRVEPADFTDAHLPLAPDIDLMHTFAEIETRVIAKDFTIRHRNQFWQIGETDAEPGMVLQRIQIEHRPDGRMHFCWRGRYLTPRLIVSDIRISQPPAPRWKPADDHPFRTGYFAGLGTAASST